VIAVRAGQPAARAIAGGLRRARGNGASRAERPARVDARVRVAHAAAIVAGRRTLARTRHRVVDARADAELLSLRARPSTRARGAGRRAARWDLARRARRPASRDARVTRADAVAEVRARDALERTSSGHAERRAVRGRWADRAGRAARRRVAVGGTRRSALVIAGPTREAAGSPVARRLGRAGRIGASRAGGAARVHVLIRRAEIAARVRSRWTGAATGGVRVDAGAEAEGLPARTGAGARSRDTGGGAAQRILAARTRRAASQRARRVDAGPGAAVLTVGTNRRRRFNRKVLDRILIGVECCVRAARRVRPCVTRSVDRPTVHVRAALVGGGARPRRAARKLAVGDVEPSAPRARDAEHEQRAEPRFEAHQNAPPRRT